MKRILIIAWFLLLQYQVTQSQTIVPSSGNKTWCPGELNDYEVITPDVKQTNCVYKWSVTNGKIYNGEDSKRTVSVTWDDTATPGVLKVTLTKCGASSLNTSTSVSYVIRSLSGKTPQNLKILEGGPLELCSTNTRTLKVDRLAVPNTGLGTNILQYDADGYEWELSESANWFGITSSELITLTPKTNCAGGTIRVRAYINTCGSKKYSAWSSAIALRSNLAYKVTAPNGANSYVQTCGKTDAVTFSVSPISCATGYTWTFPSGWKTNGNAGSGVITSDPSITLIPPPPGTAKAAIEGSLTATANLGVCSFQYGALTFINSDEALPKPEFTLSSIKSLCSNSTGIIEVKAIEGALSYSWYTVPQNIGFFTGNILLNNVSASAAGPLNTAEPQVIGKAPILGPDERFGVRVFVRANRIAGCAGSPLNSADIWVGPPNQAHQYKLFVQGYRGKNPVTLLGEGLYNFQLDKVDGATSYRWDLPFGFSFQPGQSTSSYLAKVWTPEKSGRYYIRCTPIGLCGEAGNQSLTVIVPGLGGVGTPCPNPPCTTGPLPARVYPNPVNDNISIEVNTDTEVANSDKRKHTTAELYNSNGQKIKSVVVDADKMNIETQGLEGGLYFLHIKQDDKITVKELLIKR
jgi:hypothetical protein